MNRQQRRASTRTAPAPVVWDSTFVELNGSDPEPLDGLLLILERGMPRDYFKVRPGASFGQFIRRAAAIATYGQPARLPDRIRCSDPVLAARLRADLTDLGVRVDVVSSLPEADVFADIMRRELDPGPTPGSDGDLPRWREVIGELARATPWSDLDPSVAFALENGPLAGCIVAVHAGPGGRAAIMLFAGRHDWQAYWRVTQAGAKHGFSGHAITIAPASDVPADEARACQELGLTFPDGRVVFLVAMDGGATRSVTDGEARRLLAAAEVVLAGCALGVDRDVLLTPVPATPTVLGPQDATFYGFPPELVVAEQHLCVYIGLPRPDGTAPTGIVLQLAPADARRVASQLRGADTAVLRELRGDLGVVAFRGGVELGLVAVVPAELTHTIEAAVATGRLDLAISRAGVHEPSTLRSALILTLPLTVRTEPMVRVAATGAHAQASA